MDLARIGLEVLSLGLIGCCMTHRSKGLPNMNPSNRQFVAL